MPWRVTVLLVALLHTSAATAQSPDAAHAADVERQIDAIEDERDDKYSLGGPIALMAVGGGISSVGLVVSLYGAILSSAGNTTSDFDDGGLQRTGNTAVVGGLVTTGIGVAVFVPGVVWLSDRSKKRRPYNDQIDELERQSEWSRLELRPTVGSSSLGLQLSGSF